MRYLIFKFYLRYIFFFFRYSIASQKFITTHLTWKLDISISLSLQYLNILTLDKCKTSSGILIRKYKWYKCLIISLCHDRMDLHYSSRSYERDKVLKSIIWNNHQFKLSIFLGKNNGCSGLKKHILIFTAFTILQHRQFSKMCRFKTYNLDLKC